MKKRAVIVGTVTVVILVAIVGGLVYYMQRGTTGKPLTVGIVTWPGDGVPYLAKGKGFFGNLGIEILTINDTSARRAALASGSLDVMASTLDTYANEAASGLKGKIILVSDESYGADAIVAKKEIKSLTDLKGKTIAYAGGTPSHFFLLYLLRKEGLGPADIKSFIVDDPGRAGEAFLSGSVDAAVTWEPFVTQAANTRNGHVLVSTKAAQGLIVGILVAGERAMKERRRELEILIEGWLKAIDYLKANPQESYAIMAKGLNIPPEDFKGMVLGLQYDDRERNKELFGMGKQGASHIEEIFDAAGEIWKQERVLNSPVPARDVIDKDFIRSALLTS